MQYKSDPRRRQAELARAIRLGLATVSLSALLAAPALAAPGQDQDAAPAAAPQADEAESVAVTLDQVTVTGSRIRRADPTTPSPLTTITPQSMTDRGFVQVGQALNDMTANLPSMPQTPGDGSSSGSGLQYPNLFGLGAGRTLTLVNGRRFVTSGNGMQGNMVDANMIPTGLLQSVEIVQGGGAAVYGSDAIGGVVNYVLRQNFEGLEFDGQVGLSDKGDYQTERLRLTWGTNFADGRGNVAVNLEHSGTEPLPGNAREAFARSRVTVSNPADTGPNDGIPALQEVLPASFWPFSYGGVIFNNPGPLPDFLTRLDGNALQFDADGNLVSYDPGEILGIPFARGGQGLRYADQASLLSGVDRHNANLLAHMWVTDSVKLSTELFYGTTRSRDLLGSTATRTVLYGAGHDLGPIMFNRNNPFLSQEAIDALSAANPGFGFGAPLWLSKSFQDLLPDRIGRYESTTWRAMVGLDGDLDIGDRFYYWSLMASHAENDYSTRSWGLHMDRFNAAINAVRDANGNIVCASADPACVPVNPFGRVDPEAARYISALYGSTSHSEQQNVLATFGGEAFDLPGGPLQFGLAWEWRGESADFIPTAASAAGVGPAGVPVLAQSGKYNTSELSAEFVAPLIGAGMDLPFVNELELSGAYRHVDHSTAGSDQVWSAGLRWQVADSLTLRASRSRNFRAPTLAQLYSPQTQAYGTIGQDPCDADRINRGPDPATRRANCAAEWAANPGYGDLDGFQSNAENFASAMIHSGGNLDLANEVSYTTTWGLVWEPTFVEGLSLIVDRFQVRLADGLSQFTTMDFMAACYDSVEQSPEVCGRFERDATGQVIRGSTQFFNAGWMEFRGETYAAQYDFPLGRLFGGRDLGELALGFEATRYEKMAYSVTGFDVTRSEGTVPGSDLTGLPDWSARLDARWNRGPWRLGWSVNHLPRARTDYYATIESTPTPWVHSNTRHSMSVQYDMGDGLTLRGGVDNVFDEQPSYPTINYGDIIGRYVYMGVNLRF